MPKYKVIINGTVGFKIVKEENIENFLAKYPSAVLIEKTTPTENFQNGDAETDASVAPETSQASYPRKTKLPCCSRNAKAS